VAASHIPPRKLLVKHARADRLLVIALKPFMKEAFFGSPYKGEIEEGTKRTTNSRLTAVTGNKNHSKESRQLETTELLERKPVMGFAINIAI
jgi:hypothetical protein